MGLFKVPFFNMINFSTTCGMGSKRREKHEYGQKNQKCVRNPIDQLPHVPSPGNTETDPVKGRPLKNAMDPIVYTAATDRARKTVSILD